MDHTEERDNELMRLSGELDDIRRKKKDRAQEVVDAEAQVEEARQKLHAANEALENLKNSEGGFDPKTKDDDLEQLTKETVRGRKLANELKEAEGRLSEARERVKDSDARHQDVLGRIRDTFEKHGWEHEK